MKSIICVIMLLWCWTRADILQLERWPILEGISREILKGLFDELQKSVFPDFSHDFEGFLINNTMKIKEFRLTRLTPRFDFIKPTFYQSKDDTFTVTLPLGFHITAEFAWIYNTFVLPISGSAMMDTDIYDFAYNTTLKIVNGQVTVESALAYSLIKATDIQTVNLIHADDWVGASGLLLKMIDNYYPLLHKSINDIFAKVMPGIFMKHIKNSLKVTLYYPTFHIVKELDLPLKGLSTRDALLFTFGTPSGLPDVVTASEKVNRQYCIDQGLLNTVVTDVWKDMRGTYRKGDVPRDAVYQLTVTGMGQLVPDVLLEYPKDADVTLTLTPSKDLPTNIKLERINATHGVAKNFRMLLTYAIQGTSVLEVRLSFDMVITPEAERRGTGYDFNLKALVAEAQKDSISYDTKYQSVILSNIHASSSEFLTYLILPFLGHTLLGDGVWISDDITAKSVPEFSVASAAVCLNLVQII